jgi:hypothetical protein
MLNTRFAIYWKILRANKKNIMSLTGNRILCRDCILLYQTPYVQLTGIHFDEYYLPGRDTTSLGILFVLHDVGSTSLRNVDKLLPELHTIRSQETKFFRSNCSQNFASSTSSKLYFTYTAFTLCVRIADFTSLLCSFVQRKIIQV